MGRILVAPRCVNANNEIDVAFLPAAATLRKGSKKMKTFKLKSLEVIESDSQEQKVVTNIPLIDGLAINREDRDRYWLVEAYVDPTYHDYFKALKNKQETIIIQAKISKESNDPAVFLANMIDINVIGSNINILFKGKIIDQRKTKMVDLLTSLMKEGYRGEELISKFEESLKNG